MSRDEQKQDSRPSPESRRRERIRRNRELLAAGLMILAVLAISWLQINHYGTSNSLFLFSMNLNTVLLLVVCFFILKNLYRLFLERRRKLFGARLRSRLVLAFMAVAVLPIGIMFFSANQLISSRLNYLFTGETSQAMGAALDLARQSLQEQNRILIDQVYVFLAEREELDDLAALEKSGLAFAGLARGAEPGSGSGPEWLGKEAPFAWRDVESLFNYESYALSGYAYALPEGLGGDESSAWLLGLIRLDAEEHLLAARALDPQFSARLRIIASGYESYAQMRSLNKPIRYSYTLMLGIVSLAVIMLAMWLALRLSRQITGPIVALSKGAAQLARGDLDLRLSDEGRDELGQLVNSFNVMVEELKASHEDLLRSNQLLAAQSANLEQRNQFIQTVMESISTGIVTMAPGGEILTMNKALGEILMIQPAEWLEALPEKLLAPAYAEKVTQIRRFLADYPSQTWQGQVEFVRFGRNIKLFVQARRLDETWTEAQGQRAAYRILILLDDITELASLQRLEAWQEVARRIAHEVKNPLTPIKLSAQRLERRFGSEIVDPVFLECTSLIVRESDRMHRLVSEFTTFAALPEVKPAPTSLLAILTESLELMRNSHEQIDWRLDCPSDLPALNLDAEAMHRAVLNLLTNSAEALANHPEQKDPRVQIRVLQPTRSSLLLEIEDNGPGLPESDIPRLFEPYFSRKKNGTGLGLAITRAILHDHQAEIHALNTGTGALMRLEFRLD